MRYSCIGRLREGVSVRKTRSGVKSRLTLVAAALLLATACGRNPAPPPPPVEVIVVPVVPQDVPIVGEWIGTLDGSVNADSKPKSEEYLLKECYNLGPFRARDATLFEIAAPQFQAALEDA